MEQVSFRSVFTVIIFLSLTQFLICFSNCLSHKDSTLPQKFHIFHFFKTIGQRMIFTCFSVTFFSKLLTIIRNIILGSLVRNFNVRSIVKISKVCNLVPVAITIKSNTSEVILWKDVMFVYRVLCSVGAKKKILLLPFLPTPLSNANY